MNEIFFDSLSGSTIAVTYIWGIFNGKPSWREIVEYDMVFNDGLDWGNSGPTDEDNLGDTSLYDLLNIAVHEAGHATGLGHPSDSCAEESMYRFGTAGETKKRTLHLGDITGILELYN